MMQWEQLLSLKKQGVTNKRLRIEEDPTRLGFEVDYDRIIFSQAFRSLQDKTQVIPLSQTSFVHTRLTHSLEVSVVGRSLGRTVGKAILEKHPQLESIHGYHFNDFGAIVAARYLKHPWFYQAYSRFSNPWLRHCIAIIAFKLRVFTVPFAGSLSFVIVSAHGINSWNPGDFKLGAKIRFNLIISLIPYCSIVKTKVVLKNKV